MRAPVKHFIGLTQDPLVPLCVLKRYCLTVENSQRESIGAVIRTLREAQGLTRPQLVERTGAEPSERISLEMLAKVEQGKKAPSAKTLRKLALALGIEPVDLSDRAARWEAGLSAGLKASALRTVVMRGSARTVVGASAGALAAVGALPIAGAVGAGLIVHEMQQRRQWAELIGARLTDLLANGSPEQVATALASLEQVLPPPADTA